MLWTIFVILLIMWLLGMITSYTLGGFIHLLLIIAIAVVLIQVIQGRRVVCRSGRPMSVKTIGVILIVLGLVALAYQGISYTTREKVIDLGPIEASKETKQTIPLPPVLGIVAIVGGIFLVLKKTLT